MKPFRLVYAALSIALLFGTSATARQWSPDVHASALDYSQIVHVKPTGEVVLVWWVVPEIFMPNANNQMLLSVLSRYVVIGAADGRQGPNGQLAFQNLPPLQIMDQMSRNYAPLPDNAQPPEVAQAIATLQSLARQSPLGPIAQGMHWFVFQADGVHSCMPGRLSVPLAGETYTYDTPIPGCGR
jgi:hypothetical protein